jgi:hypothetical protein
MIENGFVYLPKEAAWFAEYPIRANSLTEGQAPRPSPFDRPDARLVQAGGERFRRRRRDLIWPSTRVCKLRSPRRYRRGFPFCGDGDEAHAKAQQVRQSKTAATARWARIPSRDHATGSLPAGPSVDSAKKGLARSHAEGKM